MTQHVAKGRAAKAARQASAKERAEKRAILLAAEAKEADMQSS